MRRAIMALATASMLASALPGCSHPPVPRKAPPAPKIAVILPDSKSSARWEATDRPALQAALTASGVPFEIQNAQDDPIAFRTLADQLIVSGATVLMTTSVDSAATTAVLAEARAHHVATVDYDRAGGADYRVGFDDAATGRMMGQAMVDCLAARQVPRPMVAELDDPAAASIKPGYDAVLGPRFSSGAYLNGPTALAGLPAAGPYLDGVLAATDNLATATVAALRTSGVAGTVAVVGTGASTGALRQILAGDRCATVYQPAEQEAKTAATLLVTLAHGRRPPGRTALAAPRLIDAKGLAQAVADGVISTGDLCVRALAQRCKDAHLTS